LENIITPWSHYSDKKDATLGPQYSAMQTSHHVKDNIVWPNMINMEELSKFDFDVKNYENPPLINNIAEALEVCHSGYEKLKKKNNQQKDEYDMVQVGIALIMQMHCNDKGTKKSWLEKDLGNDKSATFSYFWKMQVKRKKRKRKKKKSVTMNQCKPFTLKI
jgi:hypothetical protein